MVWFFGIPREERGKGKGKEGVSALFDFLFIFTRGNHVVVNRHSHPPSHVPVAARSLAGGASSLLLGEGKPNSRQGGKHPPSFRVTNDVTRAWCRPL